MSAAVPSLRLWTREDYYKMAAIGVFRPGERVELIGGRIVEMSPQNSLHFTAIRLVEDTLWTIFSAGYDIDRATRLPMEVVKGAGRWNEHVHGFVVRATDSLLKVGTDVTNEMRAALLRL